MKYLFYLPTLHFDDDYESLDLKEEYYNITTQEQLIQFVIDKLQDINDKENLKAVINSKRLDERIFRLECIALPLYSYTTNRSFHSLVI